MSVMEIILNRERRKFMEIKRDYYLDKLIKNSIFIKIITVIRANGRSCLLNNLFYDHLM